MWLWGFKDIQFLDPLHPKTLLLNKGNWELVECPTKKFIHRLSETRREVKAVIVALRTRLPCMTAPLPPWSSSTLLTWITQIRYNLNATPQPHFFCLWQDTSCIDILSACSVFFGHIREVDSNKTCPALWNAYRSLLVYLQARFSKRSSLEGTLVWFRFTFFY